MTRFTPVGVRADLFCDKSFIELKEKYYGNKVQKEIANHRYWNYSCGSITFGGHYALGVIRFGLGEAWPELVLNLFYIACLVMMAMYTKA